jgi:hypothetical protein
MSVFEDKRIEVSLTEIGEIEGTEFSGVATVTTITGLEGSLHGEGQAVITTNDGEIATWKEG